MSHSRKDFGIPGDEGHRGFLLGGSSWRSEMSVGLGWCRHLLKDKNKELCPTLLVCVLHLLCTLGVT